MYSSSSPKFEYFCIKHQFLKKVNLGEFARVGNSTQSELSLNKKNGAYHFNSNAAH